MAELADQDHTALGQHAGQPDVIPKVIPKDPLQLSQHAILRLTTNMNISPLLAGTKGQKLWSASTTQTGNMFSDRMTCFSAPVTQSMDLGLKDMVIFSLTLRLWKCWTDKYLLSTSTTRLRVWKPLPVPVYTCLPVHLFAHPPHRPVRIPLSPCCSARSFL